MREQTQELVKKFEQDYEIYLDVTDALTYWIIHARIPKLRVEGFHHLHIGKKYVSGPNQEGIVLIIPDADRFDDYLVESWGKMESVDDFVKKALSRILPEKDAIDPEPEGCCGTSSG
ncbi:MAG: hypothetical protein WC626_11005 [Methanoregula sp.]